MCVLNSRLVLARKHSVSPLWFRCASSTWLMQSGLTEESLLWDFFFFVSGGMFLSVYLENFEFPPLLPTQTVGRLSPKVSTAVKDVFFMADVLLLLRGLGWRWGEAADGRGVAS